MPKVTDVFGVKNNMVLSYLFRNEVDGKFKEGIKSDKHIIVYGSSKQGKTALIQRHLEKDTNYISIGCSPKMEIRDIYSSLLRQTGIKIESCDERTTGSKAGFEVKTGFKAYLPFFGQANAEVKGNLEGSSSEKTNFSCIEFNLEIAQDISELLKECKFNKFILLENFHYLNEEVQNSLAYDLRTFHDYGYRFIILGIWREKNHLLQYNRELIDRIIEVPVEPWEKEDFIKVTEKGFELLKINFSDTIRDEILDVSFGNIGIVQELCKETCLLAGYLDKQSEMVTIENPEFLESAIQNKVSHYASSHLRSLDKIANSGVHTGGLFMPFYLVRVIIDSDISDLSNGIDKRILQRDIQRIHYRGDDVRTNDMTYLLHNLAETQRKNQIIPPLFDYDIDNKKLRIIDSTLLFFLNFKESDEILDEIVDPTLVTLVNTI